MSNKLLKINCHGVNGEVTSRQVLFDIFFNRSKIKFPPAASRGVFLKQHHSAHPVDLVQQDMFAAEEIGYPERNTRSVGGNSYININRISPQ